MTAKRYERTEKIIADDLVWEVSVACGCIDYDRCNERVLPQGSCNECLERARIMINALKSKGVKIVRCSTLGDEIG